MKKRQMIRLGGAALTGACLLVAACDLSVTNPGPLADEALNVPEAMPALVVGMSADLSIAMGLMIRATSLMSGETAHSGNYANENWWSAGDFDETHVNDLWADMQRARWEAESGIVRMQDVLGDQFSSSALAARAYLLAGFANRLLGENVCEAVFDGGPSQPYTTHFERAESQFTEAFQMATAIGNSDIKNAALAGRASVEAWQGKWTAAAADAALVPTSFVYNAMFSINTSREQNDFAYETISRREYTVYNTEWANVVGDPRVKWDTVKTSSGKFQTGQDGVTRFYRQKKYTDLGANVPLVKGTEMLVLRAEAALRSSDLAGMTTLINQERASYGLAPIAQPASVAAAWPVLQFERGAVTWLENRRFWDERRWGAEGTNNFLAGRASCIPISQNEMASNPNLH